MDTMDLLKEEEKNMNENIKASFKDYKEAKKDHSLVEGLLAKFEALVEHVKGYKPPETVIDFPQKMEVTGKVSIIDNIKAIVKFPDIQKIVGAVKISNFPNIFKVEGRVKADVDFPTVQEIKGSVNVKFPKSQTVEMDLSKVIKAIEEGKLQLAEGVEPDKNKANPTKYLPVRLTNGKAFYEIFERVGDSQGKINALLEKILIKPETAVSGTAIDILALYKTNHIDEESSATSITYIGKQRNDGAYVVIKIDETSSALPTFSYATPVNNTTISTYSGAWNGRTSLLYNNFETAF